MREFIIDRSKWRAGGDGPNGIGFGMTCLLNHHGYMCCLGQIAKQLGWPDYLINSSSCPSDVGSDIKYKKVNKRILLDEGYDDSEFATKAMEINDDTKLSNRQRESKLKSLGEKFGLDIKFVGKSKKWDYE